jgi:hypothetical protein
LQNRDVFITDRKAHTGAWFGNPVSRAFSVEQAGSARRPTEATLSMACINISLSKTEN